MDDTTLFRVVLHLLVIFTEKLFATLVSSGGYLVVKVRGKLTRYVNDNLKFIIIFLL